MFGFFHLCAHEFNFKEQELKNKRVRITGDPRYIRRITKGVIVKEIIGVIVHEQEDYIKKESIDYDTREEYDTFTDVRGYYDKDDEHIVDFGPWIESGEFIPREYYEQYLHNRIKWLVRPPLDYTVVINIIIQGDFKTTVEPKDCDVCQGNGWYVDLTNTSSRFIKSRGAYKVLQNVIKDLITQISTSRLDTMYGQRLHLFPRENFDREQYFEDVRIEVSEVETNYLLRQQEVISRLPPDEILVSLEVVDLVYDEATKTKVVMMLRVITEEEDKMFQLKV